MKNTITISVSPTVKPPPVENPLKLLVSRLNRLAGAAGFFLVSGAQGDEISMRGSCANEDYTKVIGLLIMFFTSIRTQESQGYIYFGHSHSAVSVVGITNEESLKALQFFDNLPKDAKDIQFKIS